MAVELLKAGSDWKQATSEAATDCPNEPGQRLVVLIAGPGEGVTLLRADGSATRLDLALVPAPRRASETARSVVPMLSQPALVDPPRLVEAFLPHPQAVVPVSVLPGQAPEPVRVRAWLGAVGAWAYAPRARLNAGEAGIEAAAVLLDERLALGVHLAWQPPRASGAAVPFRVQAVPVMVTAAWHFRIGRILLGPAIGVGVDWRQVELQPRASSSRPSASAVAPLGELAADLLVPVGTVARVGLSAWVRGLPTWTDWQWKGIAAYESPKWAVGLSVRMGALLPGRSP